MAYQLSDLVTKVQNRIKDTGFSTTVIKDFINDTQRDVFNEYSLPFMQTTQTYTLVDGVADITNGTGLPTNFVQAIDVLITTAGRESILDWVDYQQIDGQYPDATFTYVLNDTITATVPFTWANGDIIQISGTYNVA